MQADAAAYDTCVCSSEGMWCVCTSEAAVFAHLRGCGSLRCGGGTEMVNFGSR